MAKPASQLTPDPAGRPVAEYEQPLNERMRTFLRLEFLYQQMMYNSELDADWATRAATSSLLEIMAILTRSDLRSDVHKELDHQIENLERFESQPAVDAKRLEALLGNLVLSRDELNAAGTHFLQALKDCDFLASIKNRSSIPGGTCEFDLPQYNHWLRQPYARRRQDLYEWLSIIRPVCDAVSELLWLIRESGQPVAKLAVKGMYQHNMQKQAQCRLLRVTLPENGTLYPEISGSQYRFTVRFLEWTGIGTRAVQTGRDVHFLLTIC